MTTYKRLTARECADAIIGIENPRVLIHVRPDGDAVGSAVALSEIFAQLGKDAKICSADKIPDRLQFILEYTGAKTAESAEDCTPVSIDVASPSQLGALRESVSPALMIDHHAVGEPFADGYIVPEASSAAEALFDVALALK